jgi:hypothetical protein
MRNQRPEPRLTQIETAAPNLAWLNFRRPVASQVWSLAAFWL